MEILDSNSPNLNDKQKSLTTVSIENSEINKDLSQFSNTEKNHQNDRISPSVRAIIQKYEPNSVNFINKNIIQKQFKVPQSARTYGTEKFASEMLSTTGSCSHIHSLGKTTGCCSANNSQQSYTAKLVNKETLSCNLLNSEIQSRYEDNQLELSSENQIIKSRITYGDLKKCSNDKCIGINRNTNNFPQEIQSNSLKNINLCDRSYQSKTTISKTSSGVRIITDIFFDSNIDPNWKASRIETDIPPSRILKEFQDKYIERK